jgi:hypothetical protein
MRTGLIIAVSLLVVAAPRAYAKTVINDEGVLVIDGKKVFVIGFTLPPLPDQSAPNGKNGVEELHDAGATFLRTGTQGEPWSEAIFQREQKWEDLAARYGMHCIIHLRECDNIKEGDAQTEAMLRRIITTFRDHPGLGAWKGVDEPEWGKAPVENMVRARAIIRELDPNHPIFVVQAPRGTVETLRAYDPTYDITGADIYPVGYPPGKHTLKENKEISMVGDYTQIMRQVAGKKPVWMTLQIAWSGVLMPGRTLRFPTFEQERFMTYQAIINGVRGLTFFGGQTQRGLNSRDAQLGWNWTFWNRVLRPVVEEIGEKSPLYPALLAPDSQRKLAMTQCPRDPDEQDPQAPANIEYLVRETDTRVFVLACKREGGTVQVKFDGLPQELTSGEVLFESPRTVAVKAGAFTDWFAPFDVHVYRFSKT